MPLKGILPKRHSSAASLTRRGNLVGNATLTDDDDVKYLTEVTVGSHQFDILIDTGSADLWVLGNVTGSTDTGKSASITYVKGSLHAPIRTAPMNFSGYVISDQAYIDAALGTVTGFPTGTQGIIGLGPSTGSEVRHTMNSSAGDPPLDRIFRQNTSTPNFISVLLGRSDDPDDPFPGDLTIGEIIPGYEDISSQPKLDVATIPGKTTQHWGIFLDENGITGPDGSVIPITTMVNGTEKRPTVIIDTGFTFPQVPKSVSDAIYSKVDGAKFANGFWSLPCNQALNISFRFGGKDFPVHPLDTTFNSGASMCIGSFQPMPVSTNSAPTYDMIFGMAWLRNAYVLINFGNFVDGDNGTSIAPPFVQLLSVTNDTTAAHNEFEKLRATQKNTRTVVIAAITVLGALTAGAIVALGFWFVKRRRSNTGGTIMKGQVYRPLYDPAPAAPVDLHVFSAPHTAYTPRR
ncbi:hypothetical protein PLICRDRAFT_44924 [Plicaturopsis crispa FD-325 SS-3]|nr:hypothetical protein PLICRDRAFT_44924 [Plicaturopsis crispa FD-325 SS-3]